MEKLEVEVTDELIEFVENSGLRHNIESLYGRTYLKVYGDVYRDLSKFLNNWKYHKENSPMLDVCNICSSGYWYCSVIINWEELDLDTQRRIMEVN